MAFLGLFTFSGAAHATFGGPPTLDYDRCFHEVEPCGDPLVINQSKTFQGPLQAVGMHSSEGLCTSLEYVQVVAFGICPVSALPRRGAIAIGLSFIQRVHRRVFSAISGPLTPDVASVEFSYLRNGNAKHALARVSQISGDLQNQLQEPDPFGFWTVTVRGCTPPRSWLAEAFDSNGTSLGTAHTQPAGICGHFEERNARLKFGAAAPGPSTPRVWSVSPSG